MCPMFIATSIVASNPQEFGLGNDVVPGPGYEFDYVPVQGMISLAEAAEMAGTDLQTIKALNPELRAAHLPPSRTAYYLRIPLYSYENFAAGYRLMPIRICQARRERSPCASRGNPGADCPPLWRFCFIIDAQKRSP